MIRVALADREELTAQALACLIDQQQDMQVTHVTRTISPLWSTELAAETDILVIDPAGLSDMGFGLVGRLRAMHPRLRIVIVTASGQQHNILDALRAGAGAYVRKTSSTDEALAAIRAVHAGATVLSKEEVGKLIQRRSSEDDALPSLSPRQQQLLDGIVQGKTNREIARDLALSEKTVKNYMRGLFSALGVQDRTEAAVRGVRLDLVSEETWPECQAQGAVS